MFHRTTNGAAAALLSTLSIGAIAGCGAHDSTDAAYEAAAESDSVASVTPELRRSRFSRAARISGSLPTPRLPTTPVPSAPATPPPPTGAAPPTVTPPPASTALPPAPATPSTPATPPPPTGAAPAAGAFRAIAVKFKPSAAPDVSGYAHDTGQVYGNRGNGYAYGWSVSHTARGFYHEFVAGFGWAMPFWSRIDMLTGATTWEIAVPNGSYDVQVLAGGCNNGGFTQKVNLEGVLALNATPINECGGYGEEVVQGKVTVTVRDGRLTLSNAAGAVGNRIISVSIVPKG